MLATGDWVTPRLNDLKYFEKPPLQYWLTAASFALLGEDEWTARLPPAILGFAALLVVGFTGHRLWGPRTGVLAALILGSSWGYFLGGQYLTLDMTLTACLTIVLCALLLAQDEQAVPAQRARTGWMLAAWACAGLAVLSKGLIGIVLPAMSLAAYRAIRGPGSLTRLQLARGGPLFLAIALPWFVLVQWRNPEFFDFFLVREHLQRFVSSEHNRPGPWWYYLPILIVSLVPWIAALLHSLSRHREFGPVEGKFSPAWLCGLWAAVIIVFFTISRSKLPAYVLPALPALAFLVARHLSVETAHRLRWPALATLALGLALLVAMPVLSTLSLFASADPEPGLQLPWLYAASALLAASGLVAWRYCRSQSWLSSAVTLAVGTFVAWNCVFAFLHHLDARFSSERLIEELTGDRKPFRPDAPFFSVEQFDHSVPFYLGRTVILVAVRGELSPGIDAEPDKAIADTGQFVERWKRLPGEAYAVLAPGRFAELQRQGVPMFEILRDHRLVIVERHPKVGSRFPAQASF
jgi:4-amino-4-deoxy-L-arabinose transferase-like glycosyltransferase